MRRTPRGIGALVLALVAAAACHGPERRDRASDGPFAGALAELLARPELAGGRIGVCVVDAASGERLLRHDDELGFATASNMKLLSGAVALTTLGPEYRAATELWLRGEVRDGTLHGELVLRGHGDPTFGKGAAGRAAFATFAAALRERGVQRVAGRVVGDDRWLGDEHLGLGWQWDYLDEDYAAPFGGLCCRGNVVVVRVSPGDAGASVAVEPPLLPLRADVRMGPAGSPTRLAAKRAPGAPLVEVSGTIAAAASPWTTTVTVPDAATFAVRVLTAELQAAGITVQEVPDVQPGGEPVCVARVPSPPLAEILQPMLTASDNLYAEQLVRIAARVATGDGSSAAVQEHVVAVLTGLGVSKAPMVIADGSGLSRRNLVRPSQVAMTLLAMHRSPHRDVFVSALPLAGRTGTLRSRFGDGPAHGRVRAKTGFISRVVCLSGYVPRPDAGAPPWIFSVMLNDFTCDDTAAKAAVDTFVQRLAAAAGW
jgi:serine-type D-Ala-D-Ala carboxypeptidase/endopeptidase (penicillin-binding protein 4)